MKGKEVILGILKSGPHTGYEINDILQTRLNHFFDATFGMIYPTLKKLESEGLVVKQTIVQTDKPNKNIYQITELGSKSFDEALIEPTSDEIFKSDLLMRLYFSAYLPDEEVIKFLDEEIFRKTLQLESLQERLAEWLSDGMTPTQQITFDYGIATYTAALTVLKSAKEKILTKSM